MVLEHKTVFFAFTHNLSTSSAAGVSTLIKYSTPKHDSAGSDRSSSSDEKLKHLLHIVQRTNRGISNLSGKVVYIKTKNGRAEYTDLSCSIKAKFHYAIQVADLVADLVCGLIADLLARASS